MGTVGGPFLFAPAPRMWGGGGGSPRALRQQLHSRMQRVGSSFSTGQREPGENRVASRCPSVALSERNQAATLPVRLLKDDLAAAHANGCEEPSFQMKLDAHGFAPEDLVVRIDGQNLMVTGKRQQESNDPSRGRYRLEQSVHRQMQLPMTLDPAAMTCSLTPSGHLWFKGQNKCLPLPEAQTGPQTGQALRFKRGSSKCPNPP
ncbi:heat shock protein, alpha-crystallin-related, B9 (predicted) [Rattus norvegicus]|uniref:Heat shock protein, alpha-crystallin-related, B9 (Predicted) n=2 Tax=Rattus norvegicus TaxID=10116 RepID=A6HJ55_RAT|nr:heat shock protein beta-9 [Rattus norvegicus]EDM06060.1 heat shock protein, alpha-crystallin-related, B9 (predicted) [Rattus norvegicus]|eukprot:NP_001102305.1 heat shock protein beta-9 [Rattus norvegicus]